MAKAIRLHDYQNHIKLRLAEEWRTHRSVMMQMPTGTGKTHVLAAVVKEFLSGKGGAVWIIAHRRELVAQAEETLGRYGIHTGDGCVRVMAIQWLSLHWESMTESPSLVVIDEAHHAQARTYRVLWEKCPQAKFLGLTATPCRMNRSGFTDLFDALVCSWSIAEFIKHDRLSAFDYVSIRANSREQRLIDGLERRGADGDYQIKEMDKVLNRPPNIERLYASVRRFAENKKGIVYAISIDHARQIAAYYSLQGTNAVAIDSRTPVAERKQKVEDFKAGKIQVLVNVDVFSEGFDCPDVEFVQLARPTLSLAKYLQQVGRGLRKSDGKETCVLIDNVGLYRVFGLPTVAWDWEAMFRGERAGKGLHAACRWNEAVRIAVPVEDAGRDEEMEVIVAHDQLLSVIAAHPDGRSVQVQVPAELKAWQDENTGHWGLRLGKRKVTEAVFATVFDIRYGMAAVKFGDKRCGLVNASGETVWKKGNYRFMRFSKNDFLVAGVQAGKENYLDLHSLRMYGSRPEVKRYGDIELLKVGRTYYSRTRVVYVNDQQIRDGFIARHRFGITIFDCMAPASCCVQASGTDGYRWGYACVLHHDRDRFYWIYRWLADGSVIVMDKEGRYYHTDNGVEKRYIGCSAPATEGEKCLAGIERIARQAMEAHRHSEADKAAKRLQLLDKTDEAVPFRSGMKWGLKVGGRITVPPIYRNIKPPVGRYCAVEKNYSQWGVIALDGTWMVEPQYADIEIGVQGTVTGTKVTGSKVTVKLP